jgi:hypothetical protein
VTQIQSKLPGRLHRDDGKRFSVRADEKLTAFVELDAAILRLREFTRQILDALPKRNVDLLTRIT